jgi:RimJ/RimL family protein N-acetyltransferase
MTTQDGWWNPAWVLRTGRMVMRPVAGIDAREIAALKADPQAFAMMLGGVRDQRQSAEELAEDIRAWGAYGIGLWSARDDETEAFYGIAGVVRRPDGRGMALRFAFWPEARGHGLAPPARAGHVRRPHDRGRLACLRAGSAIFGPLPILQNSRSALDPREGQRPYRKRSGHEPLTPHPRPRG